ncbi:MAG: DNA photolyase family protein [Bacteroidia bacterium]|jgi:deoxyribodipyrimidine photo-lyase|nr:DNA photolyase family protein [Bacteroidia bacterium]
MASHTQEAVAFWFRRDLRLKDNAGLFHALKTSKPVLPVFIFDREILDKLDDKADRRVVFIHRALQEMANELAALGSVLITRHGKPAEVWAQLLREYKITAVYANADYEPYARQREKAIGQLLEAHGVSFHLAKDQVIFEKNEVTKDDGKPYTVFTPYKNRWRATLTDFYLKPYPTEKYFGNFLRTASKPLVSLQEMGFEDMPLEFPDKTVETDLLTHYSLRRDFPSLPATSRLSVHLRFGTVSIRSLVKQAFPLSEHWTNELIWREFYQQIIWHFPHVAGSAFKKEYDRIEWRKDETDFARWCEGRTGYPIVDAGMRELNATGFMHNRVRMITACFLTKHLFIDWRWGEAYFAAKLLDFDLASNNGGWQWAAGTGTDAAPYFRIFNPTSQQQKFDPQFAYIKKWVPEWGTAAYPQPMVEHTFARNRCLENYKKALGK